MTTTSAVSICNMALGHLGQTAEIASLDEPSVPARQCRRFYAPTRDELLRGFAWPFATKELELALHAEQPTAEWGYAYTYPSDCLRALRIVTGLRTDRPRPPFTVGKNATGRVIWTDVEDAVLKYTQLVEDPALFDPLFVNVLSYRLAFKLAMPLSIKASLRNEVLELYKQALAEALVGVQEEEDPDTDPDADMIRARG